MGLAARPAARQDEILAFIRGYIGEHRMAPTIRDIMTDLGVKSSSNVAYHLARLRAQGLIEMTEGRIGRSRSIRLPVRPGEPCPYCGRVE